jgi:hypothetical protein
MKSKVLLLFMCTIIVNPMFLKRTKQNKADILQFADQIKLPEDVKPFYIFCAENNFQEFNKRFVLEDSNNAFYVSYNVEDKIAKLKICLYDLRTHNK